VLDTEISINLDCSMLLFINALTKLMLTNSYFCHLSSQTTPLALCGWVQMALRQCNLSPQTRAMMGFCTKWQIPFPWVVEPGSSGPCTAGDCGCSRHWDCRYYSTDKRVLLSSILQQNVWACTFTKSPEPPRPLIGLIFRHTGISRSNESFGRS